MDQITLSGEDINIFIDAITNPAEPNEKLKQAQKNYEKLTHPITDAYKVKHIEDLKFIHPDTIYVPPITIA